MLLKFNFSNVQVGFLGFCCSTGVSGMAVVGAVLNIIPFITVRVWRAPKPHLRVFSRVVDLDETGAIQKDTATNMEYGHQAGSGF